MTKRSVRAVVTLVAGLSLLAAREARADDAIISVGGPIAPDGAGRREEPTPASRERYPSAVRLTAGPTGIVTKHGFGYGVGTGVELGRGPIGFRLGGTWVRGEAAGGGSEGSIGIYQADVVLDFVHEGPYRPVGGLGAGFLHDSRSDGKGGFAGMAAARVGFDYVFAMPEVDARLGTALSGGILGPAADAVDLRAYALLDVHLVLGF